MHAKADGAVFYSYLASSSVNSVFTIFEETSFAFTVSIAPANAVAIRCDRHLVIPVAIWFVTLSIPKAMLSLLLLKVPELVSCSNPPNQSVFCSFLFTGSITAQKWHLLVSCLTTFAFFLTLQSAYHFCWKRNSSEVRSFGGLNTHPD